MLNESPSAFDRVYNLAMWPTRRVLPVAQGILDNMFCQQDSLLENPYLPPPAGLAILLLETWGAVLIGGALITLTLPSLAVAGLLRGTRATAGQVARKLRGHHTLPGNTQSEKPGATAPRTPAGLSWNLSAKDMTKTGTTLTRSDRTANGQLATHKFREIRAPAPGPEAAPSQDRQGTSLGG